MKEDEWEFANKGGLFQSAVAADGNPWAWFDSEMKESHQQMEPCYNRVGRERATSFYQW